MIDPDALTMDHVFEVMNAWAAKYARLHDQLAAAVAEKEKLTAERDEARAAAASGADSVIFWQDRANLMQQQSDKALADLREAERERDEFRQQVDALMGMEPAVHLGAQAAVLAIRQMEGLKRERDTLAEKLANQRPHMEVLASVNHILLQASVMQPEEDFAHLAVERLLKERDALAARHALVVKDVLRHLTTTKENPQWTTVDFNYMVQGIRLTLAQTDFHAILRAHNEQLTRPLVEALEKIRDNMGPDGDCYTIADAALAAWREQHPEPPEERGEAK